MANITSINGNPISVGTDGIGDGAVTRVKVANGAIGHVQLDPEIDAIVESVSDYEVVDSAFRRSFDKTDNLLSDNVLAYRSGTYEYQGNVTRIVPSETLEYGSVYATVELMGFDELSSGDVVVASFIIETTREGGLWIDYELVDKSIVNPGTSYQGYKQVASVRHARRYSSDQTQTFTYNVSDEDILNYSDHGYTLCLRLFEAYQEGFTEGEALTTYRNLIVTKTSAASAYYPQYVAIDSIARNSVAETNQSIEAQMHNVFKWNSVLSSSASTRDETFISQPGKWNSSGANLIDNPAENNVTLLSFAANTASEYLKVRQVFDRDGNMYFNTPYSHPDGGSDVWTKVTNDDTLAFVMPNPSTEPFVNQSEGVLVNNDVAALIAMYDNLTVPDGINVTKASLGNDESGVYDVLTYTVSKNPPGKPIVLIIVGEHGNEPNSAMTGYMAYKEMLDGYLTKYLDYVDFVIMPLMNPWGYQNDSRNNYNGVNLNRDFPAGWQYAESGHNATGNYAISQKETQYLLDYLKNNRHNILFVINKHDTGSISGKIDNNQPDRGGYACSIMASDARVCQGLTRMQEKLFRESCPWVYEDYAPHETMRLIPTRTNAAPPGSIDRTLPMMGIHEVLIELSVYAGTDYFSSKYQNSMRRIGGEFLVNAIAQFIDHNVEMRSSNKLTSNDIELKTRKLDSDTNEWVDAHMAYSQYTGEFTVK